MKAPVGILSSLLLCRETVTSHQEKYNGGQRENEQTQLAGRRWNLEVQSVEGGGQITRDHLQEVAGHGKDLQAAGAVKHVLRETSIAQLVVVEIHRSASQGRVRTGAETAKSQAEFFYTNKISYFSLGFWPNV